VPAPPLGLFQTKDRRMNALPEDFQRATEALSADVTRPIPGSRKIHVTGSRPDLRVPMREIRQSDTPALFGAEPNAPLSVYDTSGPYTDPQARIELTAGLARLREAWIAERGDTDVLAGISSQYGQPARAAPREGRRQRQPDALCEARPDHAGDGVRRHPREPAP
jgi:phosphomethylpyrimidine synthase